MDVQSIEEFINKKIYLYTELLHMSATYNTKEAQKIKGKLEAMLLIKHFIEGKVV